MTFTGADSIRAMRPLFQAGEGGATPTSALQLNVSRTTIERARALVYLWHSTLPRVSAGSVRRTYPQCFVAEFEGRAYAAAIWTIPVARMLDHLALYELRRLAIAPDAPANLASRMLRVMALRVKEERRPRVLISYQDTRKHKGTIYRAAGWVEANESNGGEWSRKSRERKSAASAAPKVRWEKCLAVVSCLCCKGWFYSAGEFAAHVEL